MKIIEYSTVERNNLVDEFLTPIECIEACVVNTLIPKFHPSAEIKVCDVGANDGRWGKIVKKYFPNAILTGIEIMNIQKPPEFDYWINDDFILKDIPTQEIFIGNPPYTVKEQVLEGKYINDRIIYRAEDFVWKALHNVYDYGYVMFLLRINFKNAIERYWKDPKTRTLKGLHQQHHYMESWNLTRRPSFYKEDKREAGHGKQNTNAHDYSFFVWSPVWTFNYALDRQLDWHYKGDNICHCKS